MFIKTGFTLTARADIANTLIENAREKGISEDIIESALTVYRNLCPVVVTVSVDSLEVVSISPLADIVSEAQLTDEVGVVLSDLVFVTITDADGEHVLIPTLSEEEASEKADKFSTTLIRTNTPVSAALGQLVDNVFEKMDEQGVDLKAMSEELSELITVGTAYVKLQNAMQSSSANSSMEDIAKAFSSADGDGLAAIFEKFKTQ